MNARQETTVLKDLGAGLILRRSSPADAEALAAFNGLVHSDDGPSKPDERIAAWTRDLLARPHPTFQPQDFTIVEEVASRRIVSSLNLISQTWTYEGLPFGVGRIELVGTLPEFRGRGLVRAQFEVAHAWSAARGQPVQAITGIPYFYRQFGYEMALDLEGERLGYQAQVPPLKDGESEPYRLRPATIADLPFMAEVYEQAQRRYPIACQRTPDIWRYELDGQSENNANRLEKRILERADGEPVGYLWHPAFLVMKSVFVFGYELKAGVSWLEATPSVIRYLWETGQAYAGREARPCHCFGFILGAQHPVYAALGKDLPSMNRPYAWYLRVPDLPNFLRYIAPALEQRLANSIAAGHSGQVRINLYNKMLVLRLERGKLAGVDETPREATDFGDLGLPGLTLLQMVFGRCSFEELNAAHPDAYVDHEPARILLDILFPKRPSDVLGID